VSEPSSDILHRASRIRLVVLDSDGVLTDGRIVVGSDGTEMRFFDVRDGLGIRLGQKGGLRFAVISGRRSAALAARAKELGIDELHQRVADKASVLRDLLERLGLEHADACFVGDDLIDLPAMRAVGLAVAPADAIPDVRERADHVTRCRGGRGAVREVVELILRAAGSWDEVTAGYFGEGSDDR